jgi:site-specific DNA recombinase
MVARILAAVARAEVERKSERQRLAYEQRAKEGLPHATRAFGYAPGCMVEEPAEADAIRQAADDVLSGTSLTEIARRWVEEFPPCVKKCKEEHWHNRTPASGQAVRYLLTNPRYMGQRFYYDEDMGEGQWQPVLPAETFFALQNYFENPRVNHLGQIRTGRKPSTLLGGLAVCGTCGAPSKATKAHGVLVYGCKNGMHVNTPRDEADRLVEAKIIARLSRPDVLSKGAKEDNREAEVAAAKISALTARKTALAEDYADGIIDRAAMRAGTLKANAEIEGLETLVRMARPSTAEHGIGTKDFIQRWMDLTLEQRRQLISLYADVTLVPRGKGNKKRVTPIELQVLVDF